MSPLPHLIGATLAATLVAAQADAVIVPPPCAEANGDTYHDERFYDDGIAIGLVTTAAAPTTYMAVLQSCTAARQIRISLPVGYGYQTDVLNELHLIATSVETHTIESIAARFADRGYPVQTLSGIRPTCLC